MKNRSVGKYFASMVLAGVLVVASVVPAMASQSGTGLEAPEEAGWSSRVKTTANWDSVEGADAYWLHLFYNEEHIHTMRAKRSSANLAEYMVKEGWYDYLVCALEKTDKKDVYRIASDYTASESLELRDLGVTEGAWKGDAAGEKYQNADGSFMTAQWSRIQDKWYYFDENGYMTTGWQLINDTWYYMDKNGVMQTGWIKDFDEHYYLGTDGGMVTGWVQMGPSAWYYFMENGAMAVDTVIDGYTIDANGIWVP